MLENGKINVKKIILIIGLITTLCGSSSFAMNVSRDFDLQKQQQPLKTDTKMQTNPEAEAYISKMLHKDVLVRGPLLLSSEGRMFITASKRMMFRFNKLFDQFNKKYQIVKQEDIHLDGNIHYILEINFK